MLTEKVDLYISGRERGPEGIEAGAHLALSPRSEEVNSKLEELYHQIPDLSREKLLHIALI